MRISNPDVSVHVATDPLSARALEQSNHRLLGEVDQLRIIETGNGEAEFRNRSIKTRLRSLVDGPFLFLDSDTFVRDSITEVLQCQSDIAVACNHSADEIRAQLWVNDIEMSEQMGWQVKGHPYVNGGVLFYNDTAGAFAFAKQWHTNWQLSQKRCGNYRDQPALNAAIKSSQVTVSILPHRFNAQIRCPEAVAVDGAVWHYHSSHAGPQDTEFEVVVDALSASDSLPEESVRRMVSCPHPWRLSPATEQSSDPSYSPPQGGDQLHVRKPGIWSRLQRALRLVLARTSRLFIGK